MASGIYKIVNKKNNMVYIGRTKNFQQRKSQHLSELRRGIHHSKKLQEDFFNQDESDFEFVLIFEGKGHLDDLEVSFIKYYDSYNSGYNPSLGGTSNKGYEYSEEWKQGRAEHLSRVRTVFKGDKRSEETIQKMKDNHGFKIRFTDEQVAKIIKLRSQGISYRDIGKELGCSEHPISDFIKANYPELANVKSSSKSNKISNALKKDIDKAIVDKMVELRKQGMSLKNIGKEFGYSQPLVTRVLKEVDADLIKRDIQASTAKIREMAQRKFTQAELDDMLLRYERGESLRSIGRIYNYAPHNIKRRLGL